MQCSDEAAAGLAGRTSPSSGIGAKEQQQQQQQQHQPMESPEDMSIICGDGREIFTYKKILTAWSSYMKEELRNKVAKHPIVLLPKEVKWAEMAALIDYMYTGQVCVKEEELQAFMDGARYLGIEGLTTDRGDAEARLHSTQDLEMNIVEPVEKSMKQSKDDNIFAHKGKGQDWSPEGRQVKTEEDRTKHVRWVDIKDVKTAWALRVPLDNKDGQDCIGFY